MAGLSQITKKRINAAAEKAAATKPPKKSSGKKSAPKKKSATKKIGVKKASRWKAGTVALRHIQKYQKSTHLMMAKAPFQRLAREITQDIAGRGDFRFQKLAILTLQEVAEAHLTSMFELFQLAALHANRVTVMRKDIQCVKAFFLAAEGMGKDWYHYQAPQKGFKRLEKTTKSLPPPNTTGGKGGKGGKRKTGPTTAQLELLAEQRRCQKKKQQGKGASEQQEEGAGKQ